MKLCGVDGVIFDWYGSRSVLDFESIKSKFMNVLNCSNLSRLRYVIFKNENYISHITLNSFMHFILSDDISSDVLAKNLMDSL